MYPVRHVALVPNEKIALDRLRVRHNVLLNHITTT